MQMPLQKNRLSLDPYAAYITTALHLHTDMTIDKSQTSVN